MIHCSKVPFLSMVNNLWTKEVPVALSLSLSLFKADAELMHKPANTNTFPPNYSCSFCSFLRCLSFFLSLKFEIKVESKVSVFIIFSSEIHYF